MKNGFKRKMAAVLSAAAVLFTAAGTDTVSYAQGPTYTAMQDVYYTKDNCIVYAEPTYTSTVLTTIGANIPVQVIGAYSNGWYRINIGVICYVKMDSVTSAGAIGLPTNTDSQILDAQKTAAELGYEFVYLKLNKQKAIQKDIFNSYIGEKVILYAKIDDELGVSFKMLYNDKVNKDISLNYTKTASVNQLGERSVEFVLEDPTELKGQIAIFQFKEGYDKSVTILPVDLDTNDYVEMNTYYTEFSEFAYAPVTQVASMQIVEVEITNSLSDNQRAIMADHRQGIKYQSDDTSEYRSSIHSRLRRDTEYVDYNY
ncbi:MAG: SH3 domain-containing protein [Lachnospiraceae bacterium]|nr:SH3 domain-containing protein [Lachnospiraceae bacterium]MBO5146504.1 SH3 domain-containing protein [Lachnospiraceae bacterium]